MSKDKTGTSGTSGSGGAGQKGAGGMPSKTGTPSGGGRDNLPPKK